jgi:hypothetical protein
MYIQRDREISACNYKLVLFSKLLLSLFESKGVLVFILLLKGDFVLFVANFFKLGQLDTVISSSFKQAVESKSNLCFLISVKTAVKKKSQLNLLCISRCIVQVFLYYICKIFNFPHTFCIYICRLKIELKTDK